MKNLLHKPYILFKKQNPLTRFAIVGVIGYLLFLFFYEYFRYNPAVHEFYETGVIKLTSSFLYSAQAFLKLFGLESYVEGKTIRVYGTSGVYLDRGCLGRNLMLLFAGFIAVFPGKILSKLWFIPFGLGIIYFLNILRIAALCYIALCCPEHMDINHHFIFKYTTYAFIFLLWVWWITKWSSIRKKPAASPPSS